MSFQFYLTVYTGAARVLIKHIGFLERRSFALKMWSVHSQWG